MIYHGLFLEGVPQDHKEAYRWYRQAAEQGYASAQVHMGKMYYNGEVVRAIFSKPQSGIERRLSKMMLWAKPS